MIERRLGANAHEFLGADLDNRNANIVVEVGNDCLRHARVIRLLLRAKNRTITGRCCDFHQGVALVRCEKAANRRQETKPFFRDRDCAMRLDRFMHKLRHPAFALAGAAVFGLAMLASFRGVHDAVERSAAADPVQIADRALDGSFNHDVAASEIRAALESGDAGLAQSFVELAAERGVPVDPSLTKKVNDAATNRGSFADTAGRFVHGLWTGEPADLASLAGTAVGDLFVFGDIRDAAREGTRYLTGQKYDPWILGLAGVGIGLTAATYVTLGAGLPERVGLSLVKAARRTGRLNPALAARAAREVVKVEEAGGLFELTGNVGRVETQAGAQAALDSLAVVESPQDMSRLARLAAAKGSKTRAIIKLLGRAAIVLTAGTVEVVSWLFWAALTLFGFVSSCKAAVERLTQRHLDRRRAHRLREAERRVLAMARATA